MKKIKHLIIVALLAMFVCGSANAEFRFGVKAGLNVNKLHFNETTFDATNRAGFTVGAMTEFTVPIIGIGFDLSVMYTRMNSKVDEFQNQVVDETLGKDFLEIPLNLKYKINIPVVASIIKPMIYTGPTMALKLNGGEAFKSFKTRTVQMGWNVGVGVELIKHLQVSGGYTFGINNIAKEFASNIGKVKLRNNYWTVTAAWLF